MKRNKCTISFYIEFKKMNLNFGVITYNNLNFTNISASYAKKILNFIFYFIIFITEC